jgi:hypothetical protein
MLTLRLVLPFVLFALLHTGAAAQGLIAFPWKACPTVDLTPRCVWVVASGRLLPIRLPEHEEGNFHLEFLNPGPDTAAVVLQVRNRAGVFNREAVFSVPPGSLFGAPPVVGEVAARVDGYVVVRSDKPLLLWAWAFGQHFRGSGGPSEAAWSYSLAVIPIDCGDQDFGEKNFFSFVCDASDGPPPPK